MDDIFEWAIENEDKVEKWKLVGGTSQLASILGIKEESTKEELLKEAYDLTDWNSLRLES